MPTIYGENAEITGSLQVDGDIDLGSGDDDIQMDGSDNTFFLDGTNNKVGIGTDSPDYTLDVAGDIGVNQYIYHNGDGNTWINFTDNRIRLNAGGNNFIDCEDPGSAPHKVRINNGGNNIDFVIKDNSNNVYFTADASTAGIGIGTDTPIVKLDVHHNPTSLANDTGGGEVVTFGTGTLTAGKLYFLNSSGVWTETDADAISTSDGLLGIALGSSPSSDGVLLRGFFNAHSYLSNFVAGLPVYISTTAASMDTTLPSGTGDIVRCIGYCTSTSAVIYFNPESTTLELS